MTYSIVPNTNPDNSYCLSVILVVTHSCGHEGQYYFGGAEYAENEAATYESYKCSRCRDEDWLKEQAALERIKR